MGLDLVHSVPCDIRPGQRDDVAFIKHSWLNCLRRSPTHQHIPKELYIDNQGVIADHLIANSVVLVACSPDHRDQILGYILGNGTGGAHTICHWIHVKRMYRRNGIGGVLRASLIKAVGGDRTYPMTFSHISDDYRWLSKTWNTAFNPYLITMEIERYDPTTYAT